MGKNSRCVMTIAAMSELDEITSTSISGRFPTKLMPNMMTLGLQGCKRLRELLKSYMRNGGL